MAELIVQKYGGTSVGTPERIREVAERIRARHQEGHRLVVVVSAMGHTTDQLLDLASQVSSAPPNREIDMLLTAGERISMALLSIALSDLGVEAVSLTGSQAGIVTTTDHRRARIKRILGDRVRAGLDEGKVVIVAGFQGVSETKEITTLGRGGSDTSAVALAAALKADRCEIFTDVDGIFSANPSRVPEARFYSSVSPEWILEMAHRGAQVLHPRSVEIARRFGVPVWVLNSLRNENIGTRIVSKKGGAMPSGMDLELQRVVGVTSGEGKCLCEVTLSRPTALVSVWEVLNSAGLELTGPQFSSEKLQFFMEREQRSDVQKALQRMEENEFVKAHAIRDDIIPVSVVGEALLANSALLGDVVAALASEHISVAMGVSSPIALTVGVPSGRADDAVALLHRKFATPSA